MRATAIRLSRRAQFARPAPGHVAAAARELGYYWTVMGEVVKGDQRGRAMGFPTANITLEDGAEPIRGIYTVRVRDGGRRMRRPGAGRDISAIARLLKRTGRFLKCTCLT